MEDGYRQGKGGKVGIGGAKKKRMYVGVFGLNIKTETLFTHSTSYEIRSPHRLCLALIFVDMI